MQSLIVALAPILILALYIYLRDKYEREPFRMLLAAILSGAFSVLPILWVETFLQSYDSFSHRWSAAYEAFIVAGFTEELFKYLVFLLLIWRSKDFNEKFDGIVYSVFISLGFAAVENILYVQQHGLQTGVVRAFTSVPAHASFGVLMGYWFGLARFYLKNRIPNLVFAFLFAFLAHGLYDFILMAKIQHYYGYFIPYLILLFALAVVLIRKSSNSSIYRKITLK